MSKNDQNASMLAVQIEALEDVSFTNNSRVKCFEAIQSVIDNGAILTTTDVQRILAVFATCAKEDLNSVPLVLSILKNLQISGCLAIHNWLTVQNIQIQTRNISDRIVTYHQTFPDIPVQQLVPSALVILHIIKTVCKSSITDHLRTLSMEVFLTFPVGVLATMVTYNSSEILEIFVYKKTLTLEQQKETCQFLRGLLRVLPQEQKTQLVTEGIPIWFDHMLPLIMKIKATSQEYYDNDKFGFAYIQCMETLTEELVKIDYSQTTSWQSTLESICNSKRYPSLIVTLLHNGSTLWHRIWIVLIKLLKDSITRSFGSFGTPINSMLPVVESAFKLDVENRCRAFRCWDVLAESFANETNDICIAKRIKLLLIPLKLNNAKHEYTAMAKFNSWWNLICKFQPKLDKFTNEILLSFFHFAFGKEANAGKLHCVPGQMFDSVKIQCLQAFVEIVGHSNCHCCKDLPKLNGEIMSTKLLANNWNYWMYALRSAIESATTVYSKLCEKYVNRKPMPVICLWKNLVLLVAELPDNNVRRDLFDALISVLTDLTAQCNKLPKLPDVLFHLVLTLFADNKKMRQLLRTKTEEQRLLTYKIMLLIVSPHMYAIYKRTPIEKAVEMLEPVTKFIAESARSSQTLVWFLENLPPNDDTSKIWTALVESVSATDVEISAEMTGKVLMWPVKAMHLFTEVEYSSKAWYKMYTLKCKKLIKTGFENELFESLKAPNVSVVYSEHAKCFKLFVINGVLRHKLINEEDPGDLPEELLSCAAQITSYKQFEHVIPVLVDTIVVMLNNVKTSENEKLAKSALLCAKTALTIIRGEISEHEHKIVQTIDANLFVMINNLLSAVGLLLKTPSYFSALCDFLDYIKDMALSINKESPLFKIIVTSLKTYLSMCPSDKMKRKIEAAGDSLKNNTFENKSEAGNRDDTNKVVKEFITPDSKKSVTKTKKKEPSIVNTVSENGEEYVVVKSNWKFNPRKLTENQKEKLQRKREDIPALYQDLSQSQDEFKLATWKTDSQDTTSSNSTSSKSTTNDASTILKNMSSSGVVPKIMENILSKSDKKDSPVVEKSSDKQCTSPLPIDQLNKIEKLSTPKNPKSPRMALKDRVFRNVRNLIEKSTPKGGGEEKQVELESQIENVPKTPSTKIKNGSNVVNSALPQEKQVELECQIEYAPRSPSTKLKNSASLINSAPPLLSAERPSRVKRKPKKFDDTELFALKRGRRSHSQSDSQTDLLPDMDITRLQENEQDKSEDNKTSDEAQNKSENPQDINMDDIGNTVENQAIARESDAIEIKDSTEPPVRETVAIVENTAGTQQVSTEKISEEHITNDILSMNDNDSRVNKISQNIEEMEVDKTKLDEKMYTPDHKQNDSPKTPAVKTKDTNQKSTIKRSTKKSRIEKELAIDMVEGHPFLKIQSEKRLTRKKLIESEGANKRSVGEKLLKTKLEFKSTPKADKKSKEKDKSTTVTTVDETQDRSRSSSPEDTPDNEDPPCSEDVIESSQDSTFTTISVKSTIRTPKVKPTVLVERIEIEKYKITGTQELLEDTDCEIVSETNTTNQNTKDDIELPINKTVEDEKNQSELTENMDTEPIGDKNLSDDVIIINDDVELPITINTENTVGAETQELAEADTQPSDPADFAEFEPNDVALKQLETTNGLVTTMTENVDVNENTTIPEKNAEPQTDIPDMDVTISEKQSFDCGDKTTDLSSPFKDDAQRKQDFLNNTSEISPIKVQSPDREKPSSPKETSSDYVVVKLASPVQSNGEPFEKSGSPEFFTEDKVSPDRRDQSPPRNEVTANSGSPSSSLSLKKNRPQVRPGGRAAHMLGLCVPVSLNTKSSERSEAEEPKKSSTSTPARRNLRVLYNSASDKSDNNDNNLTETEDTENFLKFKRALPSTDSSPSVPILKRKLAAITDEATASPANKRKRVSFHDPPVSTTVSVQKYIDPLGIRSPSSAQKRLERQSTRSYTKSPKRLDSAFKLDTVLSKAVESFSEDQTIDLTSDTNNSLDVTPAIEVVKTSELNDTNPLCPELVNCKDPIENVATELSSPAMRELFIKEVVGKVDTIGDLAKMTELEVNRLCIKAPKVQVARKVLTDYATKVAVPQDVTMGDEFVSKETPTVQETPLETQEELIVSELETACIETQTDKVLTSDTEMQTVADVMKLIGTQTETACTEHASVQTEESGSKTTSDVISSCLSERMDFIDKLGHQLQESSIRTIADKLPIDSIMDILLNKSDSTSLLNELLGRLSEKLQINEKSNSELSFMTEYLCNRYESRLLILFCSQLLQKVHDKPA